MSIITRESLFDYQIKRAMQKFKENFDLEESGDELFEKIWYDKNLAAEFGKHMMETINNFDEELFE